MRGKQDKQKRKLSGEDVFVEIACYMGFAFLLYSYILGMHRMGDTIIHLLGNNILGWLVCGGVGLFLNVGIMMAVMRIKNQGL